MFPHNDMIRKMIAERMLPDKATIIDGTEVVEVDVTGVPVTQPRKIRAENVPCRVDLTRAFRPDKLPDQLVVIDEFTVTFPYGTIVQHNDIVHVKGDVLRVKRVNVLSEWDSFVEVLATRISVNDENYY